MGILIFLFGVSRMITLATYTYNDHQFALGQIRNALKLRPFVSEIIVVDDCSEPPLALDAEMRLQGVKLVTHTENRGPALAKRSALQMAAREYILSVDCDMEFSRQWVLTALETLKDPAVGLVGARIVSRNYGDPLSRGMYYDSLHSPRQNPAQFAPGGLWLMRRQCFVDLGGFDDYPDRTHEDWFLSRKITAAGLKIVINEAFPATELRRFYRKTFVRRESAYLQESYRAIITRLEPSAVLAHIQRELADALAIAARYDCAMLVYVRLARILRALACVLDVYASAPLTQEFAAAIDQTFCRYANVAAALREDCDIPASDGAARPAAIVDLVRFMADCLGDAVLETLDTVTIPENNASESQRAADFHYLSR